VNKLLQKIIRNTCAYNFGNQKLIAICVFGLLSTYAPTCFAQSIFTNNITGTNPSSINPYTSGQVIDANLTVSGIGYGSGLSANLGNDRYNLTAWPTGALSTTDYIEFVLTPNSTFKINFNNLVYTGSTSTNGPADLIIRSSVDSYTANISTTNPTGATINLTAPAFQNITTAISFRIYGFNAISSSGTFSINNFTFNGSVIPITAVTPIITSALTKNNIINTSASLYQITANNFPSSYNATNLPPGLSINSTTGIISGIPTSAAGSPYNVTISATNAAGTGSATLLYTITLQTCAVSGLVGWNFGPAITPSASPSSNTANNVTISAISQGNNNGTTTLLTSVSPSNTYIGFSAASNIVAAARVGAINTATDGSAYFEFTITPASGYSSIFNGIEFGTRSTETGPQNFAIRTSLDNYVSDLATGSIANNATWSLKTPFLSGTQSATAITYRIYGYNGTGTVFTGIANWRIDDIKLNIDVVRLPPTIFGITNNGSSYCVGGNGISVGLASSQIGVNYQLILDGNTNVSSIVTGTGFAISFGNQIAAGNYTVSATYNNTTCISAMSNPFNLSVNLANTWTGAINTDWGNSGNWACGIVPNANTLEIDIPSMPSNQPVLNSNVLISGILNLLNIGSTLNINGYTLTLNSTIIGNGSLIGSLSSNLVVDNENGADFNLNFNQISTSNWSLNNYTQNRNATVTLNNPLRINGLVNNTSNTGILASGNGAGNLTLLSTAISTSGIAYLNTGADISGNVNVQSYFTGGPQLSKRGTRMIAIPVRDNQASPNFIFEQLKSQMFFTGPGNTNNNFDLGGISRPNAVSMVTQDEFKPQNLYAFTPIGNLLTRTIPATAYFFFYRGDRVTNVFNKLNEPFADPENVTVNYNGLINKGNIAIPVTYTANIGDNFNGICAIGNPYPCVIDFDAFLADNSDKLEDIVSIIKPDRSGQITKVGNVSTNNNFNVTAGPLFNTPNSGIRYIQSGQSFYVKVKLGQSGLLTFNELHKATSSATPARLLSKPDKPFLINKLMAKKGFTTETEKVLMITVKNQTLKNETAIIFKNGQLATYEGNDAPLLTNPLLSCATLSSDDVALAINLMPKVNEVNSIKLLVNSDVSQANINLNFTGLANFTYHNFVLHDKFLGVYKFLNEENTSYTFDIDKNVSASFGKERFALKISEKSVLALHITKFEVFRKNTAALLNWEISKDEEIEKFEIEKSEDGMIFNKIGETLIHKNIQNNAYTFVDNYPYPTSYYKIKQINNNGNNDYSEIRILESSIKNLVKNYEIYPTNVSNKLNISCKSNVSLPLNVRIITLNGNIIKTIGVKQASLIQIPLQQLKAGMYIIKISNATNKENLHIEKITKQ